MKLSEKRVLFTRMQARLFLHAELKGYRAVGDDWKRQPTCSHGHPRSTHRSGLAIDIIIYDDYGQPLKSLDAYNDLHDYWDSIGGSERIPDDLGHFSMKHNGMR